MQNTQLAEKIKETAKLKGITVKQLLENCNINKGFIYDLEKQNKTPSVDKILRIADYLDCSVDYLLGRTDVVEVNKGDVLASSNIQDD